MTTDMDNLKDEFRFYLDNQDSMVEQYDGRVVAIKGRRVLGVYDSKLEAVTETSAKHEPGSFLIQNVSAGEGDYTARFHSLRVRPS